MKDWIHISHNASCGAGGVCFSLLHSPSLLHSLCKCNWRITQDKVLQSRDMMTPSCRDRGKKLIPHGVIDRVGCVELFICPIDPKATWCRGEHCLGAHAVKKFFLPTLKTRQLVNPGVVSVLNFENVQIYSYMWLPTFYWIFMDCIC